MRHAFSGLRALGLLAPALLGAGLAGCSADSLQVPNYQNATPGQILADPVAALPLLATGVLRDDRGNAPGFVLGVGILGREAYNYTPTEGRNTSGWLSSDVNNQASFGGTSLWGGYYSTLRDIFTMAKVVEGAQSGLFTDAQKNAALGFAHTMEALQLHYVILGRHNLGAPVQFDEDATKLFPFVSRDSVYGYVAARLDQAAAELKNGGSAFPFALHAGFAGFNTPATFLQFNRAIAARVNAHRASLGTSGCGAARSAACYQRTLTNLGESFLNATGSLATGPARVFSTASGDVANSLSNQATPNVVAHALSDQGVQSNGGTPDRRYTDKIARLSSPKGASNATIGIPTNFDFSNAVYAQQTTPMPIIRNEELILLRAEARYFTGDVAGALADINDIRARAGALAPMSGFASESAFIDELLYERRWSLLFEGHRWVDARRFGRLEQLPKDLASHVVAVQLPVPQAECLARARAEASLKAPGCQ
jgi:hypothetical protein